MDTLTLAAMGLAGSTLGLALAGPMIWPDDRTPPAMRLFGGWLLAVSAIIALISGRLAGLLPAIPATNHAINMLGLVAYPLLYLHLRAHGPEGRPPALSKDWWLWSPAGAYLLAIPGLALSTGSSSVPFIWLLPVLLWFTVLCARTAHVARPGDPNIVPPSWLIAGLVLLNIAQLSRLVLASVPAVRAIVPLVVSACFLALVARLVWRTLATPASRGQLAIARYDRSTLDERAAAPLLTRIHTALSQDRLFADPQLTLARLAAAAGSTPHQVSEVLNRFGSTSFSDIVTRRRVDDVKAQLRDPASAQFTIEGIGASAGFGSRSALYAAFKRSEGMTPAAFRARGQ